jgi:hypothetical protein
VQLQESSVTYKKKNKKYQQLLDDFIELSHKFDIKIIQDKGNFNGDSCMLFSDNIVVINKHKPLEQRLHILAKYFSKMNLDNLYIKPVLRDLIDNIELDNEYVA